MPKSQGEKRVRKMRKKTILLCIVSILSLSVLLAPTSIAKPETMLNCDVFITLNWDFVGFGGTSPYSWIGTVTGDVNGDLYVAMQEAWFPSPGTEHFTEEWLIVTFTGNIIGEVEGKWTMSNYKWVANGEVTDATGDWVYLIGSQMQYGGTTTEFPVPPGTLVTGEGSMHITHNK